MAKPIYRTYMFVDKDPVIDELRTAFQRRKTTYKRVHEDSGVSTSTMSNWFNGTTRMPRFATANAFARALGYQFRLTRMREG